MQTLVNVPSAITPMKSVLKLSTIVVPLKISTLGSTNSKVAKVFYYGDAFLDEDIVIPHFYFATMTLEDINVLQAAIERRKQQEIMRKEHR